jgi:murein DD-endopeptidase MepM/ murein hydrolase activator NlpD
MLIVNRYVSYCIIIICLVACTQATQVSPGNYEYNPFVTVGPGTAIPLLALLPPTRGPGTPIVTPTPDNPHYISTSRNDEEQYTVQNGDTLGKIAQHFGISIETILQVNQMTEADNLIIGQVLTIPASEPGLIGPNFKVIPDSELVFGPASVVFDVEAIIQGKGGYLDSYNQEVDDKILNGAQIIRRVAQNYSVNPRLLLALLEHRSNWLTNPNPDPSKLDYPLGYVDSWHSGLYRQLTWAANELNRGYYLWRVHGVACWTLADGSVIPINPTINAGTAGVQNLFAKLDDRPGWEADVTLGGLFKTYYYIFGYPFDYSVEPLLLPGLSQPPMSLPFAKGETWSFTGGPHGGWDTGSAWAAIDFAPPGESQGCAPNDTWVLSMTDGIIVRADHGAVLVDLDGDGLEQTGWTVLYMHIESRDRILPGARLQTGDRIGHPSCEGGVSNANHVHIARKYNGEWISADGSMPFILDGWISSGMGVEYDGYLIRGSRTLEAWEGINELNQIQR